MKHIGLSTLVLLMEAPVHMVVFVGRLKMGIKGIVLKPDPARQVALRPSRPQARIGPGLSKNRGSQNPG